MKKIVFTGAPSSGKSSAIEALKGISDKLVMVPETASILLVGGYPPPKVGDVAEFRTFQTIILHLQKNLEEMFALKSPMATYMILDRAVLDGVGYWPQGPEEFLREFRIDVGKEVARYDCVIYFDCPKEEFFGDMSLKRFHNYGQSKEIGEKQYTIWSRHQNFVRIPNYADFSHKVKHAVQVVKEIVGIE